MLNSKHIRAIITFKSAKIRFEMSRESSNLKDVDALLKLTRDCLKDRLQNDKINCYHYTEQKRIVKDLFERTVSFGESNIALIIGDRGSGKTALLTSVLYSIISEPKLAQNLIIVRLHGLLETNDNIALKSITKQLQLENEIEGKIFGSFAENLAYLLTCLKSGREKLSKSVIFILDDFHLFCDHTNQTLLYNLFDAAQSDQAPICVIGLTCRLDVVELLEKRVKSRFSHRQILLFPRDISFLDKMEIIKQLLMLPTASDINSSQDLTEFTKNNKLTWIRRIFDPKMYSKKIPSKWVSEWNNHVVKILKNPKVIESFQLVHDFRSSLDVIKMIIFQIVNDMDSSHLDADKIQKQCLEYVSDRCAVTLNDLSVLEISLLIAIKHHSEIYDHDPFNFEIILTRLNKFVKASHMNTYDRSIVLKAFEQLHHMELIRPLSDSVKIQKEFQMHKLNITIGQINKSVSKYPNLPTEITQWAQSSLI